MLGVLWNALEIAVVAPTWGLVRAVRAGLGAWRDFRQLSRLGAGVDERRLLLPEPIARVRNCLVGFRLCAEELGAERTLAIATSAIRDAENGEAFLGAVEWSYGFETRLLSGEEEAALTVRGVSAGRKLEAGTLVLDGGGGATELTAPEFRE